MGIWVIQFAENIETSDYVTEKENNATTTFVDDGLVVVKDLNTSVAEDDISVRLQSITDFLQKPQLLTSGLWHWAAATTAGTILTYGNISSTMLSTAYYSHKLEGFNMVRGTACIRVQLAANPFQAGKLLLHFLPNRVNFDAVDVSYSSMHNSCVAAMRQQPCLEIDARDSAGVIKIPFISPNNWSKVGTGYYDWGTFYLTVLAPLRTGAAGEDTVEYSTYLYFEDVELAAPIFPQSSLGSKKKMAFRTIKGSDAESLDVRPISSALRSLSAASGVLSDVPMLSSIARPLSWVSDAGAGVASFLGYSKPTNNVQPVVASRQAHKYLATSDGVDSAIPLGLRTDNCTVITDGITPNSEDEMSFSFLKKQGTVIATKPWTTTDLQGTELYWTYTTPYKCFEEGTTVKGAHVITWRCGPPIYYLSKDFGLWRGSLQYTFKFVKTAFHRGKLEFTFTPNYPATSTPDIVGSTVSLREIVDLSTSDEVTLTVPYLLPSNYIAMGDYSGVLSVKVLNELRAPETASTSVDILVYVNGGPDLEYQAPGNQLTIDDRSLPFSPQSNIVAEGVGSEPTKSSINPFYASHVNGEMFGSIKQILKRSSVISSKAAYPQTANAATKFWPYFAGVTYATAAGLQAPDLGGDPFSKYSCMFAYYKGSMVLSIRTPQVSDASNAMNNTFTSCIIPQDPLVTLDNVVSASRLLAWNSVSDWTNPLTRNGTQGMALSDAGPGIHSFSIPYYGRTKCSLALKQTTSNRIPVEQSQSWSQIHVEANQSIGGSAFFRNVGEDFQFSYYIGCPPLLLSAT